MRKLRHILTTSLMALALLLYSSVGWGQIISQYTETNSGTSPKGIEIWNNTGVALDFSANNLIIQQGTNGAALSDLAGTLVDNGTLEPNEVLVIGTTDIGTYLTDQGLTDVTYVVFGFSFNGDDALAVVYGGTVTDVFGEPGVDPGAAWTGNGVSTANQNIQLLTSITDGDTDGWTDPSLRFETVSEDPVNDLTGFGVAPGNAGPVPPSISNIIQTPAADITSTDAVSVSADVTAGDAALNSVELRWGTTSGDYINSITMTLDAGDTYLSDTDIPAQADATTVYYVVFADDADGESTTSSEQSFTVTDPASTTLPYEETFVADLGDCYVYTVAGTKPWYHHSSSETAFGNGYNGENPEEHWLVLPAINFDSYADEVMNFTTYAQYGAIDANNYLKLFYSADYPGIGDPTGYTWTELTFDQPAEGSIGSSVIETPSGDIDLTGVAGTDVYLAFKYYSTDNPTGWKVDDINIYEKQPPIALAITSVEPVSPLAGQSFDITVESQDDSQVASEVDQDTEVELSLVTGSGTLLGTLTGTIANGTSSVTITGLTYDVVETISVSAAVNTGMALTASANQSIEVRDIPVVEVPYLRDFETGDINTDGWSTQVVVGTLDWYVDDFSGNSFAKMSNYSGANQLSETWLISPAIDLSTAVSPVFGFMNACNFSGADIEVKISTDYDGFSEPSSATWSDLSPNLSTGGYDNVYSGDLDISAYTGGTAFVAFKYTGSDSDGKTWQIDDISISLSNDASLATFTLGGLDALALTGVVVADPVADDGAILFVDDLTGFAGIVITATDAGATVLVELNSTEVLEADYATQALADGDVVVATVTAEDGTMAYYKVTITSENRELTLTSPTGAVSLNTGEDLVVTWTSSNIANVNIFAVDPTAKETVDQINDDPILASLGTFTSQIPNGVSGEYFIRIADAADATFFDETETAVTIDDTQAPAVVELTPASGAVDLLRNFTLSIEFDEDVAAGTGNLTIHDAADDAVVVTIAVADVTIVDNVVTADVEGLAYETAYYVLIEAGMVEDLSLNGIAAITDPTTWTFTTLEEPEMGLFISEYIEGSSNNRAIELYNPTSNPIDLSNYLVKQSYNGQGWAIRDGVEMQEYILPLSGTLAAGEVYVIYNADAVQEIADVGDLPLSYGTGCDGCRLTAFTGNDAIGLFKMDGTDAILIDAVGAELESTAWDVAGVTEATLNKTLVRKGTVIMGNTDWAASAGTDANSSEWIVLDIDNFDYLGFHIAGLSTEADILTFTLDTQIEPAVIDATAATVGIEVLYGTNIASLTPSITISLGATIDPAGGSTLDFTSPVEYTVTAEDGSTKLWTVTVTEGAMSDKAEILTFVVDEAVGDVVIDSEAATVDLVVAVGTDVAAITPSITISLGATIDPDGGTEQDFTNPVAYTVTAQDGTTSKVWTVTITESQIIDIYDIQYTEHPEGASMYEGEVVTTQGIVTAHHFNYEGGSFRGFFIQDGEGEWNGLYVYNPQLTEAPAVGDDIVITGLVEEYYLLTELTSGGGAVEMIIEIVSSDNDLPAPVLVTTAVAATEPYEGVLVKVENAEYTVEADNFNVLGVDDGSGVVYLDDDMHAYIDNMTLNATYNITGIGHFSYDLPKILPRFAEDIELVSSVTPMWGESIATYPNPFTSTIWIDNADNASRVVVVNLLGQQVMNVNLVGESRTSIQTDNLPAGVYLVTIVNNQGQRTVRKMIKK